MTDLSQSDQSNAGELHKLHVAQTVIKQGLRWFVSGFDDDGWARSASDLFETRAEAEMVLAEMLR